MAVADAQYRFILVDKGMYCTHRVLLKLMFPGDAGRHSDGGVFSNSQFWQRLENKQMFIPSTQPLPGMCVCDCLRVHTGVCVCAYACAHMCVIYISLVITGTTGPSLPFVMFGTRPSH